MLRSRRFLTRLGLTVGSVCLFLLVAEIALRVVGFSRPNFYRPDPIVGARLRATVEGWDRREGNGWVEISEQGIRDRLYPIEREPKTYRVAVVGDSFSEALQVNRDRAYWSVAEDLLRECPALKDRKPEVINFGVSGYGTAQEYLTLEHFVRPFAPDAVVLQFFSENDVRDNSLALSKDPSRPYFVVRGSTLAVDNGFRDLAAYQARTGRLAQIGYAVVNHLRVLQLLNAAKNALQKRRKAPRPDKNKIKDPVYREVNSEPWRQAWQVTERLLAASNSLVANMGAGFTVMSVSNPIQVHPEASTRLDAARRRNVRDLFYPERRIETLARNNGFNYLPLGPVLLEKVRGSRRFLHGFESSGSAGQGHYNEHGHRVVGELLAEFLCRTITSTTPTINEVPREPDP